MIHKSGQRCEASRWCKVWQFCVHKMNLYWQWHSVCWVYIVLYIQIKWVFGSRWVSKQMWASANHYYTTIIQNISCEKQQKVNQTSLIHIWIVIMMLQMPHDTLQAPHSQLKRTLPLKKRPTNCSNSSSNNNNNSSSVNTYIQYKTSVNGELESIDKNIMDWK